MYSPFHLVTRQVYMNLFTYMLIQQSVTLLILVVTKINFRDTKQRFIYSKFARVRDALIVDIEIHLRRSCACRK